MTAFGSLINQARDNAQSTTTTVGTAYAASFGKQNYDDIVQLQSDLADEIEARKKVDEEITNKIYDVVGDLNIENGTGLKAVQGKIQEGKETFNTNVDREEHTSGASGEYAVLFGGVGEASGKRSAAFGGYNVASGNNTFAIGEATKATGRGSTAEGGETSVFGDYSHAEGTKTICAGVSAHVEGGSSVVGVNSKFGHAEGVNNTVTDFVPNQAVAPKPNEDTKPSEGAGTVAPTPENTATNAGNTEAPGISGIGDYSGFGAHAEGGYNIAYGIYSHVEGYKNTALYPYSHAEGSHTYAKGRASHAEGYFTEANNAGSHAEGAYTKTGKDYQHVIGLYNIGKDNTLFEIGNGNAVERKNIFEVQSDGLVVVPNGAKGIKIGNTILDEEKLNKLIALLDTMEAE